MTATKHDYDALEREYIFGTASVRELCRLHGINSWSAVAAQARRRKWADKRTDFRNQRTSRSISRMAESRAVKASEIADEFLDVIRAALYRFAENLKDKDYKIYPADIAKLIDKLQLLTGRPTDITEERRFGISVTTPADPETFRDFVAGLRSRASLADGSENGPYGDSEGTRSN